METVLSEAALVNRAVRGGIFALAVLVAAKKLALVDVSACEFVNAVARQLVGYELTLVNVAVLPGDLALARAAVVSVERTLVDRAVGVGHCALCYVDLGLHSVRVI